MNSNNTRIVLWGLGLWFVGYVLGFVFYPFVSAGSIGWYVTPFGVLITSFVLWRYVKESNLYRAAVIGLVWSVIAIICDYLGIILLPHPAGGYYKPDVYLYYALMFVMPIAAALLRHHNEA